MPREYTRPASCALELVPLHFDLWRYYGSQPLKLGGFPIWWAFINGQAGITSSVVAAAGEADPPTPAVPARRTAAANHVRDPRGRRPAGILHRRGDARYQRHLAGNAGVDSGQLAPALGLVAHRVPARPAVRPDLDPGASRRSRARAGQPAQWTRVSRGVTSRPRRHPEDRLRNKTSVSDLTECMDGAYSSRRSRNPKAACSRRHRVEGAGDVDR